MTKIKLVLCFVRFIAGGFRVGGGEGERRGEFGGFIFKTSIVA